jgi:hypothetical protein
MHKTKHGNELIRITWGISRYARSAHGSKRQIFCMGVQSVWIFGGTSRTKDKNHGFA